MKKIIRRCHEILLLVVISLINLPVYADLPAPPASDMADGSHDWIDVAGLLFTKAAKIALPILGVVILVGAAVGIFKGYHTAKEKQDTGHFFKDLMIALICAALGMGLIYAGYNMIPSSS